MKIKSHKVIIVVTTIVLIHLLSIFFLCYLPFVQMKDIDTIEQTGYLDDSMDDNIWEFITRLQIYPHCWFIHKGDTYKDITFIDKDSTQYNMNIKFNWDNSITVQNDTSEFNLYVNSITFDERIYLIDKNNPYKIPYSADSFFIGFNIYDKNNNYIVVYKQSEKMYYGKHRIGFEVQINGDSFYTGTRHFNY